MGYIKDEKYESKNSTYYLIGSNIRKYKVFYIIYDEEFS